MIGQKSHVKNIFKSGEGETGPVLHLVHFMVWAVSFAREFTKQQQPVALGYKILVRLGCNICPKSTRVKCRVFLDYC